MRSRLCGEDMTRIILADNCPLIAEGLRAMLRRVPGCKLEVTQMEKLFALLSRNSYRVLILELELCWPRHVEVLGKLAAKFPGTRILIYTSNSQADLACAAMRSGAAGYVRKDSPGRILLEAIRTVISGKMYIDPALADKVMRLHFSKEKTHGLARLSVLSRRERQVFEAIANGKRLKEIAAELSEGTLADARGSAGRTLPHGRGAVISAKTVATYKLRMFRKLGLKSDADFFRLAHEQGLGL